MKETIKDYIAVLVIIILSVLFIIFILHDEILLRWAEFFCVVVLMAWSTSRVGKMIEYKRYELALKRCAKKYEINQRIYSKE